LPSYKHFKRSGAQTHIVFGSQTVPHSDDRRYAICLVNTLLGAGMSSRLFQRIREELGLAYAIYTFQSFHVDTGLHGIYVGTSPDTADKAAETIREELARLADKGLGQDEIESGKRQLKGQITLSQESVTSRMYRAAGVELYNEEYKSLDEVLALIDGISGDTIMDVCREFFAPEKQTVLSLGPTKLHI
jgi:predicted Zn-dependent peptidase